MVYGLRWKTKSNDGQLAVLALRPPAENRLVGNLPSPLPLPPCSEHTLTKLSVLSVLK